MKNSRQNTAAQILESLTNDIIQGEYSPRQKLHINTLKIDTMSVQVRYEKLYLN